MGCFYCVLHSTREDRLGIDGLPVIAGRGFHLTNPSIASKYSISRYSEPPPDAMCLPRTNTHHVMGPMHVAYAVCSVYMALYGA